MSGGDPSALTLKRAPNPVTPPRTRGRFDTPPTPDTPENREPDPHVPAPEEMDVVARGGERSNVFWNVMRTLEVKVTSSYLQFTPGNASNVTLFQLMGSTVGGSYQTGPAQGSAINQRVGNMIMLRRVHIRGTILYDFNHGGVTPKGDDLIRVVLFWNRQPLQRGSSTALVGSEVFDQGAGVNGLLDDFFVSRYQAYIPVFDRVYRAVQFDVVSGNDLAIARIPFEIDVPVYHKVNYNASGQAVQFAPCFAVCDFQGTSYVQMKTYLYFSDC